MKRVGGGSLLQAVVAGEGVDLKVGNSREEVGDGGEGVCMGIDPLVHVILGGGEEVRLRIPVAGAAADIDVVTVVTENDKEADLNVEHVEEMTGEIQRNVCMDLNNRMHGVVAAGSVQIQEAGGDAGDEVVMLEEVKGRGNDRFEISKGKVAIDGESKEEFDMAGILEHGVAPAGGELGGISVVPYLTGAGGGGCI